MEKLFNYQGTNISYRRIGKGPVIVLLHGFGEDGNIFNEQIDFLKHNYCIIVPDIPGSGKSELLRAEVVNLDDYAEAVYQLLQHEKIEILTMLGHSMGGYITLAFAEKYPNVLCAFGLIHSSALADNAEKKKVREQAIGAMNEYGAASFLKNTIPNLFAPNFKKTNKHIIDKLIEDNNQFSKEALIQYYTAMIQRPDRTSVLENTLVPVLFVIGTEDAATPLDVVIHQVHLPKISQIHIIPNVGHMSMLETPVKLNEILKDFMLTSISFETKS